MFTLLALLVIGYVGGCFGRVVWLFVSSGLVLVCAPVYLISQAGAPGPVMLLAHVMLAIMVIQYGTLVGLLRSGIGWRA